MNQQKDKVAVVTGGSSGIGKAIARRFADEGAKVIITGRHEDTLKKAAAYSDSIDYLVLDMTAKDAPQTVLDHLNSKYDGQLDILVNNAGWCPIEPLPTITDKDYDAAFNLDVKAVVLLTVKVLDLLEKSKGNVINISSIGGEHGIPNLSLYTGAKAAIENLTRSWALELAEKGVRVNAIAPGAINTNIWNVPGATKEQIKENSDHINASLPFKRRGNPAEVANVANFLASDEASYVSGSIYAVDGAAGAQ